MNKKNKIIFYLLIIFLSIQSHLCQEKTLNDSVLWHHKDLKDDKILGISLEKWKASNKEIKNINKKIIVAVIDTRINKDHEDLKNQIWVNKKEIPNNGIDDDKNGFIDDINGWNFIGHKNGYDTTIWMNFEFVRMLKSNKKVNLNKFDEQQFSKAKIKFESNQNYYKLTKSNIDYFHSIYKSVQDSLQDKLKIKTIKTSTIDSLIKIIGDDGMNAPYYFNNKSKTKIAKLKIYKYLDKNGYNYDNIEEQRLQNDSILFKDSNIEYNDRLYIGDDSNKLYPVRGNNNIGGILKDKRNFHQHSTKVSGIIAATINGLGINGFSNDIVILPISITCSGDEHDKDIANAIYYAVNNGAKVINMSFYKEFSMYKEWVDKAMKYAEKKNVLIVHCAGNDNISNDENWNFPSDYDYLNKKELVNNFINVGSTNNKKNFISSFTNYGKNNVDIFAPGEDIYTTDAINTYSKDSGTSLAAPMVSGTAALIWLYYPKLTAKQVKDIILESGTSYDIEVLVPGTTDKKVKFSELSKSGKVLNVYNAMQLAEKVSKGK